MTWTSNAMWPCGTLVGGEQVTTDTHETKQQAQAVASMLERDGFGGDGEVFPVRTWVAQVPNV